MSASLRHYRGYDIHLFVIIFASLTTDSYNTASSDDMAEGRQKRRGPRNGLVDSTGMLTHEKNIYLGRTDLRFCLQFI